jgi:hypothetical protein
VGQKTNYSPTFPMYPGSAAVVTPSDTVNLVSPSVIYVGVFGNVRVTTATGDVVTFLNVPTGSIIPVQVLRVMATSTTATNMVAIY